MKPKLVKVKTPNKMIALKGKLIRSPFEAIINSKNDLDLLKSFMNAQNVDYEITVYIKPKEKIRPVIQKEIKKTDNDKKIKLKSKTLLEKISNEKIE